MGVRIPDAGRCLAASFQGVPCRSPVKDASATRWPVSWRSLDSATQGPEPKQQSPGFLIPTATHIKPGSQEFTGPCPGRLVLILWGWRNHATSLRHPLPEVDVDRRYYRLGSC